ncbi:TonB-dependent receptor [Pseudoduganella sp. LjRoot289]|uniref:TonB-dependent receptor domain-containing protein n=1 Tax=Pseudoduganella sp. LjRoot289 TaxID=3342314 RepID=UPI003ECF127C
MQKIFLTCCVASGAALLPGSAALAQTKPAAPSEVVLKAKPEPKSAAAKSTETGAPVTSVTVAGERPTNRIDRQVYDVKSDVGSSNGTAADALNNVPSVAVDPDGTVTLRGSTNVQILVDGKPSAMMQGDNRGATLNALAADDIESVEVINNPGAQFGNEGGGGPILNLVMRRNRKPGGFATVNANGGTAGRYNSAVSGSYNEGPWGYQGGINVRHDGRNSTGETVRDRFNPATGATEHSTQASVAKGLNNMAGLNGLVSYNLGAQDTLTASASYNARGNDQTSTDRYVSYAGAATIGDYVRSTLRDGEGKNYSWGARWDRKGALPGETLKTDLRVSASDNRSDSAYANVVAVRRFNAGDSRSRQSSEFSNRIVDFTGDYERPLAGGTAKLGYKLASTRNSFDTLYAGINLATLAETADPARSNRFNLEERTVALYGSYQMRLNERWGALAGLRAEYTDMDIEQVTSGTEARNSYVNAIPSFFATYKASDTANLRFSYAHRIRRPLANDLNPYVVYRDELNVSSGNPMLKPTKTDSFELGYETRFGALETNLRGYFRSDTDAIVDRRYFIGDNVLLTTRENGGSGHAGGLEFTVNGKLTPSLTLNTSGNLARSEQTARDLTGAEITRSATSLSGRARLNYQVDSATQLQAALQMQGKTLTGQGYREPNRTLNLSLRRALTPQLNLVLNVTDVFSSNRMASVIDTATLKENTIRRFDGRVAYIGLSYRIGGASSAAEARPEQRPGPGQGPGQGPGGPPRGEGAGPVF